MERTAVQLHTLRDLDDSVSDLVERVGATSFDGVEFAGLGDDSPDAVADALDDAGVAAAGAHVDVETLEADPERVAEEYGNVIGTSRLVVPYLPESDFESVESTATTAARLEDVAETYAEYDLDVLYHNHTGEFADASDDQAFDLLVEQTSSLGFELDAGWALAAGRDPAGLLSQYGDRIDVVHVKDVYETDDGWESAELGTGELDVIEVVAAALDADVSWFVYEHDDPRDPETSLDHGARKLDEALGRWYE